MKHRNLGSSSDEEFNHLTPASLAQEGTRYGRETVLSFRVNIRTVQNQQIGRLLFALKSRMM